MSSYQDEKVVENRLRRIAVRRGYTFRRNRLRDPLGLGYGHYYLCRSDGTLVQEFADLSSAAAWVPTVEPGQ